MVISASRRTDIPAFYWKWMQNRLEAGFVLTRNPMNHSQVSRVSLAPQDVDCIVFWTKDPEPMLETGLDWLEKRGYPFYFQFTLTPYGRKLERNLRPKHEIAESLLRLSHRLGPERVVWRYDPIILGEETDKDWHEKEFAGLCEKLEGAVEDCTISFVDLYARLAPAVKSGLLRPIGQEEMQELAFRLSEIGKEHGIRLSACCEPLDLSACGVGQARCVDSLRIRKIAGVYDLFDRKDKNQRPGCGCAPSVDIGMYHTCQNGCVYCYANQSIAAAFRNAQRHDPRGEFLVGKPEPGDRVTERRG